MPGPGQLLGGGEAGRAGADDGNGLAGEPFRWTGLDLPCLEGPLDDGDLDLLDGHRLLVDAEDARGLARRRAEPPGELGEVVRRVEALDRLVPAALPGQVVPLRDEVAEGTAVVAERDTAVHAPARLALELVDGLDVIDLGPVHEPDRDRAAGRQLTVPVGEKALRVSHGMPPRSAPRPRDPQGPGRPAVPRPGCRGGGGQHRTRSTRRAARAGRARAPRPRAAAA